MTLWQQWTGNIATHISRALGETVEASEIVVPPDTKLGDFAFACFAHAKTRKMNPAELAKQLVNALNKEGSEGVSFEAVGPYVNVVLDGLNATRAVVAAVRSQGDRYGQGEDGQGETLLLEYAQPNTHKEIHVGHLRNLVLGAALHHLLTASGWRVVPLSYHGDVGAHVAKCLWQLVRSCMVEADVKNVLALTVEDAERILGILHDDQQTSAYLGALYTQATRSLEALQEGKEEVSAIQRKLEAHDPGWERVWLATRAWCLEDMKRIFIDLGVTIDRTYLESEVVERGQLIVDELCAKGIAKESQGAIVVDLEEVKLGVFLIRKSDGTSLYATKDLALAELKLKEYPGADRSLILVDNRQALYFKQLFETLRRMGVSPVPEFIGYEFVTLKSGAMSSREGNVVTYQEFAQQVGEYANREVAARHTDWLENNKNRVAEAIALGGIKFAMLKQDPDKIFTFDMEQALSFEGATGPYCQYAVTRLKSILRKAEKETQNTKHKTQNLEEDVNVVIAAQKILALTIAQLPEKVALAAKELRPSIVAQWCLEMAQVVNAFYRDVPVLLSNGDKREERIELVKAAEVALSNGLHLLGIPTPEEM